MDDFHKSIKNNLEQRAEPNFNPAAWKRMQAKLVPTEESSKERPFAAWLPVLSLLLIGSLGLNYWFFNQSQSTGIQQKTNFIHQIDTIVQTNIVYRTDTIVQTINKETASASTVSTRAVNTFTDTYLTFLLKYQGSGSDINQSRTVFATAFASPKGLSRTFANSNFEGQSKESSNTTNSIQPLISSNLVFLENSDILVLENTNTPPTYQIELISLPKERKSFQQVVYPMRPKGWMLGATGGIVYAPQKAVEMDPTYNFGVEGKLLLLDNFRLFANSSYSQLTFESPSMNPSIGIPTVDSPSENFLYDDAHLTQKVLQFGLGIEYVFGKSALWKPSIGLGWDALRVLPYTVSYEFEHQTLDDSEVLIQQDVSLNRLITNRILVRAGLAYHIQPNWSIQLDGFYRYNYKQTNIGSPNIIGFQTGLFREF